MKVERVKQVTLDGSIKGVPTRHRFDSPTIDELRKALLFARQECWTCGDYGYELNRDRPYNVRAIEVFDDPWADKPDIIYAHDSEQWAVPYNVAPTCVEATESSDITDFHYFTCGGCIRQVIVRCPSNGWHTYYRIVNDGDQWCLACIEDTLKDEGIAGFPAELEELFERGRLFGMFFNDRELEDAGWVASDYRTFVDSEESAMALAEEAKRLHEAGRLIIIGYESLAIGASEGYVTLFSKEG